MPHHVKVVPVRLRERSDALDCDTMRIVAYRAVCSCGWRSPSRRTVAALGELRRSPAGEGHGEQA